MLRAFPFIFARQKLRVGLYACSFLPLLHTGATFFRTYYKSCSCIKPTAKRLPLQSLTQRQAEYVRRPWQRSASGLSIYLASLQREALHCFPADFFSGIQPADDFVESFCIGNPDRFDSLCNLRYFLSCHAEPPQAHPK